jgi:hypothetical protein
MSTQTDETEISKALNALLNLLQSEEVRDTVLSVGDASLVELCRDLISGLSKAVRLPSSSVGMTAVAVFGCVCQSEKARQLLLQHSDTEPIFERIPPLLSDLPEHSSIPLSVAYLTRYPSAQRRVLASGRSVPARPPTVLPPLSLHCRSRRRRRLRCAKLLAGLNVLMLSSDPRIASDAACAVGNLAFNDEGRYQVPARPLPSRPCRTWLGSHRRQELETERDAKDALPCRRKRTLVRTLLQLRISRHLPPLPPFFSRRPAVRSPPGFLLRPGRTRPRCAPTAAPRSRQ